MTDSRTAYLVLGMHRSGTSAVTQLLALAGARLPEHVMPGDEHNAKGYFEPWRIAMFNDERLRAAGGSWDDVFGFPFRPLPRREERRWLVRGEALFEDEYGRVAYPLLKDPRVTVLMPFWRTLLDDLSIAARCVIPVRHPLAVAASLQRRDGFPLEKSVLLWASYMLAAEAYTRDLPRVFVDYDALLGDWRSQVSRIETAHAAPLPRLTPAAAKKVDDFLSPDLRHNPSQGDLQGLGWAGELAQTVFEEMASAAADRPIESARLTEAAAELERRRASVGPLISPITSEADRLRFELRQARDEVLHERRRAEDLLAESDKRREIQVADVREAWEREREVWERQRDEIKAAWSNEAEALKALSASQAREMRKAWKRDVEVRDRELRVFYEASAEAERMIDDLIAKP